MESGDKPKKQHKKKNAGVKSKKKKEKKDIGKVERHNPKAHTFSGGAKSVQKRVQYSLERQAQKERAPKVDKNPDVPPPFIVVVQGPPGVGKSTLIHSLVKHYARQRLLRMGGPVTLVSGRQRRLTIIECPQDMSAMLDLAKIADMVLVMIDASFGFELETFEFINILQVHGFPRIIGVLTHLDSFRDNKTLRKVKKSMKQRFWSEIFDGAKLFSLSGLQYGRYHRVEVQNLARFIAVQRSPMLSWRQSHPYLLALRWEDQTEPTEAPSAPRKLDLYGYVYGGRLREGSQAHLAGVGDFQIVSVKTLSDPCPPPVDVEALRDKERDPGALAGGAKPKKNNALRTLAERHRIVYAPGSDIGSITVDSDAMYINVPEHEAGFTAREGEEEEEGPATELPEAVRLVRALQGGQAALDRAVASRPTLKLTKNATVQISEDAAAAAPARRERRSAPSAGAAVDVQQPRAARGSQSDGGDEEEDDADDEEGEEEQEEGEEEDSEEHRNDVLERAAERFKRAPSLAEAVYGGLAAGAAGQPVPGAAGAPSGPTDHKAVPLFDDEDDDAADDANDAGGSRPSLRGLLGNLGDLDAVDSTRMATLPGEALAWGGDRIEDLKGRKFITGGWSSAEEDEEKEPGAAAEADGEVAAKGEAPVAGAGGDNFVDGASIATFVRIRLEDVPAACVAEFKRERPLILGGLLPGESRMGYTQVRVKRHRWHPKLLKSGDALLLSVGWRRFQTVPTFSLEDRGEKRMRFLKYTLEHAHCTMTTYGPMVPPNAGILAFRSWEKVGHFRVCGTGVSLESAPNFEIMKKLKLVGEPYKIFRNTAFIRNMFNSDLEVSKYAHTKIQTVSGIRGEIKKAEGTKGSFRATFEDRILMSDLVVCKCWINVEPKKFYHPVVDVANWRPARLIGELRANAGMSVPSNADSQYQKELVRPERRFNPLQVPKALQMALPFKTKPKNDLKKSKNKMRRKTAIVSSERERAVNSLLERLRVVRSQKRKVRAESSAKKKAAKETKEGFIQAKRDAHAKEARKKRYAKQGTEEARRRKAMRLD